MKLLKHDGSHLVFLIGKRERELLATLLRRYPVIIGAHYRSRHPAKTEEAKKNQELLEEALAEQQKENRRLVEQMLAESGRFKEAELGFTFSVTPSEAEWMLQVLNDVRVGSWIQLGEPDTSKTVLPEATEQNVQLAWAMEVAGHFQHALLEAVSSSADVQ